MPLSIPSKEDKSSGRKMEFFRNFSHSVVEKVVKDAILAVITLFGVLTIIGDLVGNLHPLWYICYIVFIIGYFAEKILVFDGPAETRVEGKPHVNS